MAISMELTGMDELMEQIKNITTGREFDECNKEVVKKGMELAKTKLQKNMPVSKDLSKSGKKGYRPSEHSKDAIPTSNIKNKKDYFYGFVGWEKDATDMHFYCKFINYGTTKMKPRDFIQKTYNEIDKECENIAKEYFEKLVERLGA